MVGHASGDFANLEANLAGARERLRTPRQIGTFTVSVAGADPCVVGMSGSPHPEESTMAERQETSVMVSIQEILRDAQSREEQEKVEAESARSPGRAAARSTRRAGARTRRRPASAPRKRSASAAPTRSSDAQAEIQAMQEAHVQRARSEAEAQARLAEMAARQEHERQLHALSQDKHKKRLTMILVGPRRGARSSAASAAASPSRTDRRDRPLAPQAQLRALQDEKDKADQEQARLKAELENTKDPEKIAALQAQLDEQQTKASAQLADLRDRPATSQPAEAAASGRRAAAAAARSRGRRRRRQAVQLHPGRSALLLSVERTGATSRRSDDAASSRRNRAP